MNLKWIILEHGIALSQMCLFEHWIGLCIASHSHSQTLTHHIIFIMFLFFLFSFLRAHIHMAHFLHGNLLIFRYVCGTVARSNSKHNQFMNAWGLLEFYIIFFFLSFFRQTFQWIVRCFALFFGYQSNFIYIYFWLKFDLFQFVFDIF